MPGLSDQRRPQLGGVKRDRLGRRSRGTSPGARGRPGGGRCVPPGEACTPGTRWAHGARQRSCPRTYLSPWPKCPWRR